MQQVQGLDDPPVVREGVAQPCRAPVPGEGADQIVAADLTESQEPATESSWLYPTGYRSAHSLMGEEFSDALRRLLSGPLLDEALLGRTADGHSGVLRPIAGQTDGDQNWIHVPEPAADNRPENSRPARWVPSASSMRPA